jgi:hypothetical protein
MTLIIIMEYAQEVAFSYSVAKVFKLFAMYALSPLKNLDGLTMSSLECLQPSSKRAPPITDCSKPY